MSKTKRILFGSAALAVVGATLFMSPSSESAYTPDKKMENQAEGYKGSAKYFFDRRKNWETNTIPEEAVAAAQAQAKALMNNGQRALDLTWVERGPDNIGGRTRAIIFDKDNPTIMFTGGVAGGLFFSTTAGQSWWRPTQMDEIAAQTVCAITQDKDGYIYFGTGEGFYQNTGDGTGGMQGTGIYKSDQPVSAYTDLMDMTFSQLSSTWTVSQQSTYVNVNKLVADMNSGRVYASTKRGLRYTDDGGATWTNPLYLGSNPLNSISDDVEVASDGGVYAVAGKKLYYSENGNDGTFEQLDITAGASRLDVAVSPTDPNYVYVIEIGSDDFMREANRSTDKGQTWEVIGEGGSDQFSPFGTPGSNAQGGYDLACAVYPGNPDKIMVGGVELWTYEYGQGWERIGSEFEYPGNTRYVHADKHAIAFHPTDYNKAYIVHDGGVTMTDDGGESFNTYNRQYNVTQFYSVACDRYGRIIGGTQDNSNQFLGVNSMSSQEMYSGDGAYTAISYLNPEIFFMSSQYGNVGRSANAGVSVSQGESFISDPDLDVSNMGTSFSFADFVAPFRLWEDPNMENSIDSAMFVAEEDYATGDTVTVSSNIPNYYIDVVLDASLSVGDTLLAHDPYQSKFFLGLSTGLWMTREALDFSKTPTWIHLTDEGSTVGSIEHTLDGDIVYYSDMSGKVFRVSNLNMVLDSASGDFNSAESVVSIQQIGAWGQSVTGIAVDPNDNEHIVVTLGGYGNNAYVYESNNAASTTSTSGNFTSIHTNLPDAPVYDALISYDNSDVILVGTEYGIYAKDGGNTWTEENMGMSPVPTLMLIQQTFPGSWNFGTIYAATHGRGMFECTGLVSVEDEENNTGAGIKVEMINIYPNPTADEANVELTLTSNEQVNIEIFDINGRIVLAEEFNLGIGTQNVRFDVSRLAEGNYLVQIRSNTIAKTAKLAIKK